MNPIPWYLPDTIEGYHRYITAHAPQTECLSRAILLIWPLWQRCEFALAGCRRWNGNSERSWWKIAGGEQREIGVSGDTRIAQMLAEWRTAPWEYIFVFPIATLWHWRQEPMIRLGKKKGSEQGCDWMRNGIRQGIAWCDGGWIPRCSNERRPPPKPELLWS